MNDVYVRLAQFDPDVKGLVAPTAEGDYHIYINSIYNFEQQQEIYRHEVRHILENHFYTVGDISSIERAAGNETALLDEIARVEDCGLPLHRPLPAPEVPDYSEVPKEVVCLGSGLAYELPLHISAGDAMRRFERWLEQEEDRRSRLLDHRRFFEVCEELP